MNIDVRELPEFQFIFGDVNPHIYRYFETFANVCSCLPPKRGKGANSNYALKTADAFRCMCNESNKRYLKSPANIKKVIKIVKETPQPLVIVPVVFIKKHMCKAFNKSRHFRYS